jgi:hypothetical protein
VAENGLELYSWPLRVHMTTPCCHTLQGCQMRHQATKRGPQAAESQAPWVVAAPSLLVATPVATVVPAVLGQGC